LKAQWNETPRRGDDKMVFGAKMALFGTFWHFLAPFGTLFRGGARKTEGWAEAGDGSWFLVDGSWLMAKDD
jgi:hypothetical protein